MTKLVFEKNKFIDTSDFGNFAQNRIIEYNEEVLERERITKTKIRGILDLVNKIYNRVMYNPRDTLSEEEIADIAYLKVKLAYECSREESSVRCSHPRRMNCDCKKITKKFIEKTFLMNPIDEIIKSGSKDQFLLYARYVESLVAYFKYYGGKD